jgi:hypothetical protein
MSHKRPVEWILWNPSEQTALIVISEEAELLIPIIRAEKQPRVHLATYATPITKNMLHFNTLSYYVLPSLPVGHTIPDWLSLELGIFAGRLYLDFSECAPLKEYLQLADNTDAEAPQGDSERGGVFTKNPISFLLEWLTLCRKGQDIMHTPMGYICQGRSLNENHPFFVTQRAGGEEVTAPTIGGRRADGNVDEEEEEDTDFEDEWGIVGGAAEEEE